MSRIVIVAYGSRGDVAPFTGLGVRLRDAGHAVAIAATAAHADLVRGAGLEYRFLATDPEAGARGEAGTRYMQDSSWRNARRLVPDMVAGMREVAPSMVAAAEGADVLLLSPVAAVLGYHIAEGLGVPSIGAFLLPASPTGDFLPPVLGADRSLGRWGNRTVTRWAGLSERVHLPLINEIRTGLGIAPTTTLATMRRRDADWPILYGYSEHVVPRPRDWHPGLQVTGYWWPDVDPAWRPSTELTDFLEAGPPPVFVGFGSSAVDRGEQLGGIITAALRRAGVRGVVQAGWAGLRCEGDDALTVGEVPYPWLFPRCSAVVHHAGAGTTAAGLVAGVPSVPVPGIVEQPFWARRLVTLGLAPDLRRQKDLDADWLAGAITRATTDPGYRDRTRAMAARLTAEDGAQPVLDAVAATVRRA